MREQTPHSELALVLVLGCMARARKRRRHGMDVDDAAGSTLLGVARRPVEQEAITHHTARAITLAYVHAHGLGIHHLTD